MTTLRKIAATGLKTLYSAATRALMSADERELARAFKSHQAAGSKALFVFIDVTAMQTTYMGTPDDCTDIREHLDWNRQEDPHLLFGLVAALDTARDFKSQWPYAPGSLQSLASLLDKPVITCPALINAAPQSPGLTI